MSRLTVNCVWKDDLLHFWLRPQSSAVPLGDLVAGLPPGRTGQLTLLLPEGPSEVKTWAFPPGEVAGCLIGLEPESPVGQDTRVFSLATRWALALVVRQRWLPLLQGGRIVYQAVFDDPSDRQRLKQIAAALPPSARAAHPDLGSREMVKEFVVTLVDQLVGRFLDQNQKALDPLVEEKLPEDYGPWLAHVALAQRPFVGETLERELKRWTKPLRPESSQSRLCFWLVPPPEDEDGVWTLRFLLQSRSNPEVTARLEELWDRPGSAPAELRGDPVGPVIRLLTDLGRAVPVYPDLGRAMAGSRPKALKLSLDEAHHFLYSTAWLLQEMGFGVLLPGYTDAPRKPTLGMTIRSADQSGLGSMVDYHWKVEIEGRELTFRELETLSKARTPLVKLRGEWVLLEIEDLRQALKVWKKGPRQNVPLVRALAAAEVDLPVEIDFVGELSGLESLATLTLLEQPPGLLAELRPYQRRGYSWMSYLRDRGLGACLADDMGLGKTIQVISLWLRDQAGLKQSHPSLLVCPTSIVTNWKTELGRFAPDLKVLIHHGSGRVKGEAFVEAAEAVDIVITTYSLTHRDKEILQNVSWLGLVIDEAQNIKNPSSLQSRAVRSLPSTYRVALTGTPIENRLTDLWSLMDFLHPKLLGSHQGFRRRFALPIERYGDEERRANLKELVGPFILRRLKTDPEVAPELPEKVESKVFCRLTKEQRRLYHQAADELMKEVTEADGIERKGLVLKLLTQLKQLCNHPRLYQKDESAWQGRSGKLERLEEMLEELLASGDRSLIFSQFAGFARQLSGYLEERLSCEVLCLHGALSRPQRDEMVTRFQSPYGPPVFVISLKAGGVGLNLTRASKVFHFDRWWNPAVENQATDRAYRIGQSQNVQVFKFISSGTLEEKIDALLERKSELSESVIGTGEHWLSELDEGQLRELLSLEEVG